MTKSSNEIVNRGDGELDVMIIGGGAAGLTASIWCVQLGLKTVLIERKNEYGGQMLSIHNVISNYPARNAKDGREMSRFFLAGVDDLDRFGRLNTTVEEFDAAGMTARLDTGETIHSRAAVIATGVRRRKLGIKGEIEFRGRGILESGAKEKATVAGRRVAIAGGGDAALENALILSEFADKVYVIHRRNDLRARADFTHAARANERIEFLSDTAVTEIIGNQNLEAIILEDRRSGGVRTLHVDALLIRIGAEPNTEIFRGQIEMDDPGYILVDSRCQTSCPGVFAAGDVANPVTPTIISAAGAGATAAKAIYDLLNRYSGL